MTRSSLPTDDASHRGSPPYRHRVVPIGVAISYAAPMRSERRPSSNIEVSLLRVVVGYRVFGAVWLVVLAVITLAGTDPVDRPAVVVATAAAVVAWTGLTVRLSYGRSAALRGVTYILLDTALAAWTLLAPDVAGSGSFAGGYALAAVFHGAFAFGWAGGLGTAAGLSAISLWRVNSDAVNDLTASSGAVLVYWFAAAASAWTLGVIRSRDALRQAAEAALLEERTERIRAEERADLAARIHDGVLQTLALIQRDRDDPVRVSTLARRQERELRRVLYGTNSEPDGGFKASLVAACADVEELSGVAISCVVVGDRPGSPVVDAAVMAAREAVLNAAKYAEVETVAVYGEADAKRVVVYVRDRGRGFTLDKIGEDRRGIAESIRRRVEAVGGTAELHSAPGAGTEVIIEIREGK